MNTTELDAYYGVTPDEEAYVSRNAFSSRQPLRLKHFPARQKRKYIVLKVIATEFEPGRRYDEQEINAILAGIHEDYVTLRRYLVDYKLLQRTTDGRSYWRSEAPMVSS